jgi:hypothetical protein
MANGPPREMLPSGPPEETPRRGSSSGGASSGGASSGGALNGTTPRGSSSVGGPPNGTTPRGSSSVGGPPNGTIPRGSSSVAGPPNGTIPRGSSSVGGPPNGTIPRGSSSVGGPPNGTIPRGSSSVGGPPGERPPGGERHGRKRKKIGWKPILTAIVVLVIIWQLGHVLLQSHGKSSTSGQKASAPAPPPKPSPAPVVTLGGHRISAAGGPLIVLNPGLVSPGGRVLVEGSGFTPKTSVVVWLRIGKSNEKVVAHGRTTGYGVLTVGFTLPMSDVSASKATVIAQQAGGGSQATAALVTPGGMGTASIYGKAAGKPGDRVTVNATGFAPGEKVNVYWGRINGTPASTLTAGSNGSIQMASIPVGLAPTGPTTLVLVGQKTHTTATAPYLMLGLYPSLVMHPYAVKAGHSAYFTGAGFAPNEQVLIYLDATTGTPALTAQANSTGSFSLSLEVPFGLKGRQRLTAVGSESRSSTTTSLDILPYYPSAQASTYSALPGTYLSFYAKGFAANEVVLVYCDGGPNSGQLVDAFRTNAMGSAAAQGRYIVPSGVGPALYFTLRGQKSGNAARVKVTVGAPPGPSVKIPPQPPYVLPPSLGGKPPPTHSPSPSSKAHPSGSKGSTP